MNIALEINLKIILIVLCLYSISCYSGECEDNLNTCLTTLSAENRNAPDSKRVVVATAAAVAGNKTLKVKNIEKSNYTFNGVTVTAEYQLKGENKTALIVAQKDDFRDACYEEYKVCVALNPKKK